MICSRLYGFDVVFTGCKRRSLDYPMERLQDEFGADTVVLY